MSSQIPFRPCRQSLGLFLLVLLAAASAASAQRLSLDDKSREAVASGILLDLATDLAGAGHYDGLQEAVPLSASAFRQLLFQVNHARVDGPAFPRAARLRELAREGKDRGVIPLALLDLEVQRVRESALQEGTVLLEEQRLQIEDPSALEKQRLFAAAALLEETYRGSAVDFALPEGEGWITNRPEPPLKLEWDFDDGSGFVSHQAGEKVRVRYRETGEKILRLRTTWADGDVRVTRLRFTVQRMDTPSPTAVWDLVAEESYAGAVAAGNAYLYLAPGHTQLTRPVVLCEGFDMDNTMDWEELYELGNQQDLVEILRQLGFDSVVLNFDESTDYIQRNGLLLATLLQQIDAVIPAGEDYPLIGASMGGLVSRYALAWMEQQGMDHRVRTFVSFDSPQTGANIPLGMQYWLGFFASEAEEAAYFISRLQTPAARQMLLALAGNPPNPNPGAHPLRATLLGELDALGGYPALPRLVAVANGSGSGLDQGFAAGAQIIRWEYRSLFIDIDGNAWSLADNASQTIFRGEINLIWPLPDTDQTVSINGAPPWDNAPGGLRGSMGDLDASAVPYGDVIALHENHCFIPTTSALGLDSGEPFRPIEGATDVYTLTPFDSLYYPTGLNQEHVEITEESLWWFLGEIVPELPAPQLAIERTEEGLQLSWTAVPAARSYRVEQTMDPSSWPATFLSTEALSLQLDEEQARGFFRVTASLDPVAGR